MFDNQVWIIGGSTFQYLDDIWRSSDGDDWTLVTESPGFRSRTSHGALVFDNKLLVIGGLSEGIVLEDVWFSEIQSGTSDWDLY